MKKLLALAFMLSGFLFITSCNEDDPETPDAPSITPGSNQSVQVEESVTASFTVTAPGTIASITAAATVGTATAAQDLIGATTGTVDVEFAAPSVAGTAVVTLTVEDESGQSEDAFLTITISEEPQKPIVDVFASGDGVGTTMWDSDNVYVLRGFIFVNDGQTLTIEAGTVIKGQPGQGAGASALIVAQGGTLIAEGTSDAPIIFTGLADDLEGSVANDANALWGGLIMLGKATTNNLDGQRNIEGIPTEDSRGVYGGDNDDDDSGSLKYVSIRHGGSLIGSDNEINGLTLGGVGKGTTFENIEVFSNLDDGVEFFGGAAEISGLIITYAGDDGIDIDEGYHGKIDNGIVWRSTKTIESDDPREEWDGGDGDNEALAPYAIPTISNVTFVCVDDAEGDADMSRAFYWRDNNGTSVIDCIVVGYDKTMDMERRTDKLDGSSNPQSSWHRFDAGNLKITGNIFYNINGVTDAGNVADFITISDEPDAALETALETYITDNNTFADPGFGTGADTFVASAGSGKGVKDTFYRGWSKTDAVISQ